MKNRMQATKPAGASTLLLLGALALGGCAASARPTATSTPDTTNRAPRSTTPAADPLLTDVAKARPRIESVPVTPTKSGGGAPPAASGTADVTGRADAQLAAWATANEQIKLTPGFRILAYTGPSRDEAMRIRTAVIRRDPTEHDYLIYEQPTFRLKIGDYFTRLEAEQALVRWRDVIPKGLIIAEPVSVR